jgi:hypothetical protein
MARFRPFHWTVLTLVAGAAVSAGYLLREIQTRPSELPAPSSSRPLPEAASAAAVSAERASADRDELERWEDEAKAEKARRAKQIRRLARSHTDPCFYTPPPKFPKGFRFNLPDPTSEKLGRDALAALVARLARVESLSMRIAEYRDCARQEPPRTIRWERSIAVPPDRTSGRAEGSGTPMFWFLSTQDFVPSFGYRAKVGGRAVFIVESVDVSSTYEFTRLFIDEDTGLPIGRQYTSGHDDRVGWTEFSDVKVRYR